MGARADRALCKISHLCSADSFATQKPIATPLTGLEGCAICERATPKAMPDVTSDQTPVQMVGTCMSRSATSKNRHLLPQRLVIGISMRMDIFQDSNNHLGIQSASTVARADRALCKISHLCSADSFAIQKPTATPLIGLEGCAICERATPKAIPDVTSDQTPGQMDGT